MKKPEPVPWPAGAVADLDQLAAHAPCVLIDIRGVKERWDGKRIPASWGPWRIR